MSTDTLHDKERIATTTDDFADEHDSFVRSAYPFLVFAENDKYGKPTGHAYYRCTTCGGEIMTGEGREHFPHEAGCPHATAEVEQ